MTKRQLSDEDLALWRLISANVEPLRHSTKLAPKKAPAVGAARAKPKPPSPAAKPKPPPPAAKPKPPPPPVKPAERPAPPAVTVTLAPTPAAQAPDRRTATRLKRGQIALEAKLDLHGMTQGEAHEALNRFIAESRERGRRCVLVVTGMGGYRGALREPGILRRSVPRWLAEAALRDAVMSFAPAEPRHGGQGALYVLLRKKRGP
jgi:DNA-nicking Smr family endonuclease